MAGEKARMVFPKMITPKRCHDRACHLFMIHQAFGLGGRKRPFRPKSPINRSTVLVLIGTPIRIRAGY
jgi:hypothetical protein